jgi:NAD(P)-dependent dehydrogenase (short-subunit alcohol dehydrogenase family)
MNILVTGASRGIGKEIALSLKNSGNVFVTARSENALKELGCADYFVCDLAEEKDLISLGDYIRSNRIDVLVNNAGEYIYSAVEQIDTEKLNHIISVNLKAPVYLSGCAVPYMKKNNFGRIINIGSISGVMGEAGASAYSATKAGLVGFSKAAGLELAEFGITVNTINPGWVDTDMGNSSANGGDWTKDEILECIPQKRFVSPDEVAGMVKYLISDEAKGVTGQSINLCAGLSVGY